MGSFELRVTVTIVSEVDAPDSDTAMVEALRHFQLGGANIRLPPTGLHVANMEIQVCDDGGKVLREVRQMRQSGA
ncbi:MAG: hypothetical protein JWL93_1200 [Hyphomicrobiales bacterium]|nr:hypothetical protein [Hyphomicrobiales bacterium]